MPLKQHIKKFGVQLLKDTKIQNIYAIEVQKFKINIVKSCTVKYQPVAHIFFKIIAVYKLLIHFLGGLFF